MSAYGGLPMWAGTVRMGLTMPGWMRPSVPLWQRLYLRPDPHQHGSLAVGRTAGGWFMGEMLRGMAEPDTK